METCNICNQKRDQGRSVTIITGVWSPTRTFEAGTIRYEAYGEFENHTFFVCDDCHKTESSSETMLPIFGAIRGALSAFFGWEGNIGKLKTQAELIRGQKEKGRKVKAFTPSQIERLTQEEERESHILANVCPYCDLPFNFTDELNRHIASWHKDAQPKFCPYCDHPFVSSDELNRHIANRHKEGTRDW